MKTSIAQDDCDRNDTDVHIGQNFFTCIEEQRKIYYKDEAKTNFTDSFSQISNVNRPV